MSCLNIFAFTYVCSIIFSLNFSNALEEINSEQLTDALQDIGNKQLNDLKETKSEQLTGVLKNTDKSLDYTNRKEIADKYLNTLSSLEETWVDPYDMISFTAKERQEMSLKMTDQSTVSVSSVPTNDDMPFRKNVKADFIYEKVLTTDQHAVNKETESDISPEVKSVLTDIPEKIEESLTYKKVDQEIKSEKLADVPENSERSLDYTSRQEITKNYINSLETPKETWIDPHDTISFSVEEQQEKSVKPSDQNTEPISSSSVLDSNNIEKVLTGKPAVSNKIDSGGISEKCSQQICLKDSIYVSRWLKKLLLKIEKDSDMEPSDLIFSLDSTVIDNLKHLSVAKSLEIAQLDDFLCGAITQTVIKRKAGYDWSISFAYSADILWGIVYVVAFCVVVYALHLSFLQHPKLTLLCCAVVVSVFWHWMHLYQQRKAYKYAELSSTKIPTQCRKHEFGLLEHIHEYFKSYFTSNECAKYYEALLVDPFWEVSFTVAASEAVTAILFQPLSASSRAINSAAKQLFDGLPFFTVIFLVAVIFLLILIKCNYRIKLPFFLGAIEPAYPAVGSRVEDIQPSKTLLVLKDKICKVASSIQDTNIKEILEHDFDVCADTSGEWKNCTSKSIKLTVPRLNTNSSSLAFLEPDDTYINSILDTNSSNSICLESINADVNSELIKASSNSICLESINTDVNSELNKGSPTFVSLKSIDVNSKHNRNSSNSIHLDSNESSKTSKQASNNDGTRTDSYFEDNSRIGNPLTSEHCCSNNLSSSDILQEMHADCKVCGSNASVTMGNMNSAGI